MNSPGLIWLTGLAGAGKTTIGTQLHREMRDRQSNVVFLDGDSLREIFEVVGGFDSVARCELAFRYARLCKALVEQDLIVICATISMFHAVRNWNRENIQNYYEVYVRVPIETLVSRDQKFLYSRALQGEELNVVGIDLPFEAPRTPDLIIDNDGEVGVSELVQKIISTLGQRVNDD